MHVANVQTSLADEPSSLSRELESSREERMTRDGISRYRDRQTRLADRGTASDRDDYASLIRQSLLGVADKISSALERTKKSRGPRSRLLLKLETIEGAKEGYRGVTVAYITLSTTFSCLVKTDDRAKIATLIGYHLNNEANFQHVATVKPKMWERLVTYAQEHGSYRHQVRFIRNTLAKDGEVLLDDWSVEDQRLIGEWLLKLLEEAGLIHTLSEVSKDHTVCHIALADHIVAWLEEYRTKADAGSLPMITPVMSPMTTVPRDWSTPRNGGYEQIRYPLVQQGMADYAAADMSKVYAAVNLMQRTPWRINHDMLTLVTDLWSAGRKVGKLPRGLAQQAPERIADEDWAQMAPDEKKAWLIERRLIHADNRQAASDLVTVNMILAQARELKDAEAIYMPHFLDYRGRAYAQPLLNPQKADYVRSMLELANGKPVGEQGGMWLALQVASLWDGQHKGERLSKLSFQDRYDWVLDNEAFFRRIVKNPVLTVQEWANADKPFMFLRTAMDWVGFLDEGENFVSHVPIALDGSCSGIQHYAAILRDAEVGARVNLVTHDKPADVYGDVAQLVRPLVEADKGNEYADWWLQHGVTRKVVKRPTMTYGYSSRETGFTRVYNDEFIRPASKGRGDDAKARYLARKTLQAVKQLLPAVANGMDWLMTCAALLAHEGKGISWTAPSGFPVTQKVMSFDTIRVETTLGGVRIRITAPGAAKKVSKAKQKNGISPNHTHSLDAAHLVLTVLQAHEYGVTDFALIHDSFGTLAADTDKMFSAVRDAFVDMYEANDPFQHLYDQVYAALSEEGRKKLPFPPAKGNLDLSQVQQSDYAFA